MATEQVLRMNAGAGETSYTSNSLMQKKVFTKVKPILEESIKAMLLCTTFESHLKVAELGCSSGPNSLLAMSHLINVIDKTNLSLNREPPIIQIYLNDLIGNDFNSIFKLLPDFYQKMQQERGYKFGACFINATPGSFHGRLFPNNYIHLFHSSYALHWLSKAPKDSTKRVEPLNKGNIYITATSPPSVHEAYLKQFKRDFKLFLQSRSEELIPGGIMVFTFIGREKARETRNPWAVLGTVLSDMVQEGLVEEAKLDYFDLPIYGPTAEEVRQVIEEEVSFTIQTLNTLKVSWDANHEEDVVLDNNMRGKLTAKSIRAVFEPLLEVEFGKNIMDELFSRFGNKVAKLIQLEILEYTDVVVSLTKNL